MAPRRKLSNTPKHRAPKSLPIDEVRALPIGKFAAVHGVNPSTVWRAIKAGRLKTISITGRRKLVVMDVPAS